MRTILVAEDDYGIRQTLEAVLSEQSDWVCSLHPDGLSFLIETQTVQPHLIILDHNMSGVSGLQVYRLLRERETMRHVPVLFVTALPEIIRSAFLAGPHDVLAKPFDIDVLVSTMNRMLDAEIPGEIPVIAV